mmetsp:Transcript_30791/g.35550  ORF Transcript_30791/g.35550 Transcript_30791/m.35550 type:complete len:141 (+) Transcript_30791:672-1094(+)
MYSNVGMDALKGEIMFDAKTIDLKSHFSVESKGKTTTEVCSAQALHSLYHVRNITSCESISNLDYKQQRIHGSKEMCREENVKCKYTFIGGPMEPLGICKGHLTKIVCASIRCTRCNFMVTRLKGKVYLLPNGSHFSNSP